MIKKGGSMNKVISKEEEFRALVRKLTSIYTREEIAVKMRVSYPTVCRWINNERIANYATMEYMKRIIKEAKK